MFAVYLPHDVKTISCMFSEGGGGHEGDQTGNDRGECGEQVRREGVQKKRGRKLAILTRGSVFPSRAASKGKSENTVQQLSGAQAGSH